MPVYAKGDKWRVVVWHRGTRHDFIQEGTKAEAKQFEAAKRIEFRSHDPSTAGRHVLTFSEFSKGAYLAHAERQLKERTLTNRAYTLKRLIDFFGSTKLTDLSVGAAEEYKQKRIDQGIGASTINDELKVFRTVIRYAHDLGVPAALPKIKDVPTHGVKRKVTAWTAAEVTKLIQTAKRKRPEIAGLVVFLVNTGCRKGEAIALEWSAVDLKRGLIRIEPGEEWQPKDGEARQIPISADLLPWLKGKRKSKRWVFPNRSRERYAYWPQRAFDQVRKAAKLKGGPHTARHTFATHFLGAGGNLHVLAKILGHSTSYVTDLYGHLLPDHLEAARNIVSFGAA